MNRRNNKYRMVFFLFLTIFASITVFDLNAFASEGASEGRKLWNSIMLWVNFGIMVFFFLKFGKKPLMNFLHGESEKIEKDLDEVNSQLQKARSHMDAEAERLEKIDGRLKEIRENILSIGQREKAKIIEKAKNTANQMIEDAKKESQYQFIIAKKGLGEEMLDIAISLVVERLKTGMSAMDNEKIIDRFTSGLATSKEYHT